MENARAYLRPSPTQMSGVRGAAVARIGGATGENRSLSARAQASKASRANAAVFGSLTATLFATSSATSLRKVGLETPQTPGELGYQLGAPDGQTHRGPARCLANSSAPGETLGSASGESFSPAKKIRPYFGRRLFRLRKQFGPARFARWCRAAIYAHERRLAELFALTRT